MNDINQSDETNNDSTKNTISYTSKVKDIRKTILQNKIVRFLVSVKITFWGLIGLFVITTLGTLHQVKYGLYNAQQEYFYSWITWIYDVIPFPGAQLVLWILFLNLLAVTLFSLRYTWSKSGIIMIHIGLITLLVGSFITYHLSVESSLTIKEGESSNVSMSYRDWELALWTSSKDGRNVEALDISENSISNVHFPQYNVSLKILSYYPNANAYGPKSKDDQQHYLNASGIFRLAARTSAFDTAENIPGVILQTQSIKEKQLDILLYGGESKPLPLQINGNDYFIKLRRKRFLLPITIKLIDFIKVDHPGTQMAKSYESKIEIFTNSIQRKARIYMNNPLRFDDFTFFQSSYRVEEDGTEYSTLSVVKNVGRLFPYVASLIISFGLLLHFMLMLFKKLSPRSVSKAGSKAGSKTGSKVGVKGVTLLIFIVGSLLSFFAPLTTYTSYSSQGEVRSLQLSSVNLSKFAQIPVLEGGRIKPIDTFARNILLQLSGKSTFDKKPALLWLSRVLFDPHKTFHDRVFLINNPETVEAIGITPNEKRRYNYAELQMGLSKLEELTRAVVRIPNKEQSITERELLRTFHNVRTYIGLTGIFQFLLPHKDFVINNTKLLEILNLTSSKERYSFLEMYSQIAKLNKITQPVLQKKQETWSELEKDAFKISRNLYEWSRYYKDQPFKVIPVLIHGDISWLSPFDILLTPFKSEPLRKEVSLFHNMLTSYKVSNESSFDQSVAGFLSSVKSRLDNVKPSYVSWYKIDLELFYNKLDLFYLSEILYGLAFILIMIFLVYQKKVFYYSSYGAILLGTLPHLMGTIMRMIIMGRPPVTNLYETFVFVALSGVLVCIVVEKLYKTGIGIISASSVGLGLLLVSGKFGSDGDTLKMMVAVLDSNFWLATHVITISMGYAGCCIAGIIGHIYILQSIFKPSDDTLPSTYQAMYGALAFGLVFSFVGTVLGGIWADQSWGRFWGWDPKENGALLIVLWCCILLHARFGNLLKKLEIAYGSIIGIIVVMMAWFGINLLGVGLHAYGFTEGVAGALYTYITIELLFIILTYLWIKKKTRIQV